MNGNFDKNGERMVLRSKKKITSEKYEDGGRISEVKNSDDNSSKHNSTENREKAKSIEKSKSKSKMSGKTGKTTSTIMKRRQLEAEIWAEKEMMELEAQQAERRKEMIELEAEQAERRKELIKKQLEVEKLRIHEECGYEDKESEENVESDRSAKMESVRRWVNNIRLSTTPLAKLPEEENPMGSIAKDNVTEEQHKESKYMEHYIRRQNIDKALPIFSGNPSGWLLFITEYNETTKLCKFSAMENINRLRKCLRGEAKEAVKMLLISHKNVTEIINTLTKLYGRPEYIIKSLLNEIKMLPTPKEDKPGSLIKFSTVVNNLVTTIKCLDEEYYLVSPQLLEDVVGHLPPLMKQRWPEYTTQRSERPSVENLAKRLRTLGDVASLLHTPKICYQEEQKGRRFDTLITTEKILNCKICKVDGHELRSCKVYRAQDIQNRWKVIKDSKLCYACLQSGHSISNCKARKPCNVENCKKLHHPTLHSDFKPKSQENVTSVNNVMNRRTNENENSKIIKENENIARICHINRPDSDNVGILLRVLPVTVKGPAGAIDLLEPLLDEASTVTLIDEGLSENLGLNGKTVPLCLQWTNEIQNKEMESKMVSFKIGKKGGINDYEIEGARTLKNLSLPRQSININKLEEKWPYLRKFNLE